MSWVEYDLDKIVLDEDYGIWPPMGTQATAYDCGANCGQGTLAMRYQKYDATGEVNNDGAKISSNEILDLLQAKRRDFEVYNQQVKVVNNFNERLSSTANLDYFEWAAEIAATGSTENTASKILTMPRRPEAYSGMSFETTMSKGGFGEVTSGMYEVTTGVESGYKPYGALGQGPDPDMAVTLDHSDVDRVMIVSVIARHNLGFYDTTLNEFPNYYDQTINQEAISIEIGSYGWRDIDFGIPMLPEEQSIMVMDGAKALAASVAAVAFMLY